MSGSRKLRSWFTSIVGDTPVGGFYKRFRNGSKPNQETFENLMESAAFHSEINSAAQVDTTAELITKQGLGIAASDVNAKAGDNTALGSTGGTLFTRPSNLPVVVAGSTTEDAIANNINSFSGVALTIADNAASTSKNTFLVILSTAFKNWLIATLNIIDVRLDDLEADIATSITDVGTIEADIVDIEADIVSNTAAIALLQAKNRYVGTSTSNTTIGTGSKSFTTTVGLDYVEGTRIRLASNASSANYMEGNTTSYNSVTGALVVNVDTIGGTGTFNDWNINIGGSPSLAGNTYVSSSSTSLLIGIGSTAFSVGTGYSYSVGNRIRATDNGSSANFMEGNVLSYSAGILTIDVDTLGGSGILADWAINLGGINNNPWISLTPSNGWDNYVVAPSYRKTRDGYIEFKGGVVSDAVDTSSSTFFTLPVGYRPTTPKDFVVFEGFNATDRYAVVKVSDNGIMNLRYFGTGAFSFIAGTTELNLDLSPIRFNIDS